MCDGNARPIQGLPNTTIGNAVGKEAHSPEHPDWCRRDLCEVEHDQLGQHSGWHVGVRVSVPVLGTDVTVERVSFHDTDGYIEPQQRLRLTLLSRELCGSTGEPLALEVVLSGQESSLLSGLLQQLSVAA